MGLISGLVGLPLAPLKGVTLVAEQVRRQAEDDFYDPARIRAELREVERLRAQDELDDETATAWEDELVERLLAARQHRRSDH